MDNYLYLLLNLFSFTIPFLVSFERKRLHFIQFYKPYFFSIITVGIFFIIWDIIFTDLNVWSFNPDYLIGISVLNLPLEEWMFFLLIPYASNFIHYSLLYLFPTIQLGEKTSHRLTLLLLIISLGIAMGNRNQLYTLCSFGFFSILMLLQYKYKFKVFKRYSLSFVVILIPFIIVNSWLTGSFTSEPVVIYNNQENLGIRIGTIPLEDFFYCFTMLYPGILIFERLTTLPKKLTIQ